MLVFDWHLALSVPRIGLTDFSVATELDCGGSTLLLIQRLGKGDPKSLPKPLH
jgi:hypothetical protein